MQFKWWCFACSQYMQSYIVWCTSSNSGSSEARMNEKWRIWNWIEPKWKNSFGARAMVLYRSVDSFARIWYIPLMRDLLLHSLVFLFFFVIILRTPLLFCACAIYRNSVYTLDECFSLCLSLFQKKGMCIDTLRINRLNRKKLYTFGVWALCDDFHVDSKSKHEVIEKNWFEALNALFFINSLAHTET